ncbi:hypothetical protein AB0G04_28360 [Actinoplanes sp. NPDC023801]|uniref:hypothetical protein n=1 Tax=Actinoplanes sp. NPDC023801 TaxID=3154595 RepID=UPI0033CF80B3
MALAFAGTAAGIVIWPAYLAGVPDNTGMGVVCGPDGRGYRDVPAYGGLPPHPIIVQAVPPARLPSDAAPAWQWHDIRDTGVLQLAACVRLLSDTPSGEFCSYTRGLPQVAEQQEVRTARYEITVFELRTHRVIDRQEMVGDHDACPEYKLADKAVYTGLSDAQLHAALDRHVDRPG